MSMNNHTISLCKKLLLILSLLGSQVAFAGSPMTVTRGDPITINWNVLGGSGTCKSDTNYPYTNPTDDTIRTFWGNATQNTLGSQSFTHVRAGAGVYTFSCVDPLPPNASDTILLTVIGCSGATPSWDDPSGTCVPGPSSPTIGSFTATTPVPYNTPSTLTWSGITNASGGCSIDKGIGVASIPGGSTPTPNLIAPTTYTLTCKGTGPDAVKTVTVNIASPVIPAGAAGFSVVPSTVVQGTASKLFWNSSGATSCSITADSGADPVTGGATSNAVGLSTGPRTINTKFTLTCTNGVSADATAVATLTVTPAPAPGIGTFTNDGPIAASGTANLSWGAVTGVGTGICTITGLGQVSDLGGTIPSTTVASDTPFTLACDNGFGVSATKNTVVKVWTATFGISPTCTINDGFSSCPASISWTSANSAKVSLYDSTPSGYYGTFSSGAHSSSVTIPYGGGSYQIRQGDNNDAGVVLASTFGTASCNPGSSFILGSCKKQYTITVNQNPNGTIAPSTGPYLSGEKPTFTITPDSGYHIVQVTLDGSINKGSIISYTFLPLAADHTITATYALGPPPTGTLSANPLSCSILTNDSFCNSNFTWITTNPIGSSQVVADGFTGHDSTLAGVSGTESLKVNYGGETYRLYNNSLEISSVYVGAACATGGWDTISNTCVDPQPTSINFIGGNFFGPGTVTVTCSNASHYAVYKSGAPTIVRATTTYPGVPVVVPIVTTDTYWYVCIQGSFAVPSTLKDFTAPPPPTAIVSLEVSPRTISKDGLSTLSWNILYPIPACTFTAKSVCANDSCSQAQTQSEQSLNTKIMSSSEYTDQDDKYSTQGPRTILTSVQNVAPGHLNTDQKGFGKKTFKISHTTDFTINCGGVGHAETKRVQVTKSDEQ